MKVYKIKVNGKAYEVEVETVTESDKKIEVEQKKEVPSGEGQVVKAPMAGTILSVKVNVGDKINVGDTLAILEAMKLENEVKSQVSGVVAEVKVSKGTAVKNGDPILVVK